MQENHALRFSQINTLTPERILMKKENTLISGQSSTKDTPERQAGRLTLFALLLLVLMSIFLLLVSAVGGITFPSPGWLVLVFAGLTILLLVALVLSGLSGFSCRGSGPLDSIIVLEMCDTKSLAMSEA